MTFLHLNWLQAQWLMTHGVPATMTVGPFQIMSCRGERSRDGRFDPNLQGPEWFVFQEEIDFIFWQPLTGAIASDTGRAFALGEELIDSPATTAFDQHLNIYAVPLEWLVGNRHGIVVLNWQDAFERLRDVSRVAVADSLITIYRQHMRPKHMPKLAVLSTARNVA